MGRFGWWNLRRPSPHPRHGLGWCEDARSERARAQAPPALVAVELEPRRVLNVAPVLSGLNNFTAISEDDTTNAGNTVSSLVSGQITDADVGDPRGVAVIGRDNTNGAWEFSTDGGNNWNAFGVLSNTSATLLADNVNTRIRFVPNANFAGTVAAGITVRAWDQATGSNGATGVDVSTNGGATAFSTATATASITVTAVNDAPVLSGAVDLPNVTEDDTDPAGATVTSLISGQVTDVDAGAQTGIAVIARDNTNGTWQFSTNNGGNWTSFGVVSNNSATVLFANANTRVRFVPTANFNGTVAAGLTFRAWDRTDTLANATTGVNVSTNGGTTAYSTATAAASVTVTAVNDAPVLAGGNDLTAINEDDANPTGDLVSDLIAGQVTDVDTGALAGIAVIGRNNTNGTWQFSTDSGGNWTAFGALSNTSATLLAANASTRVRFLPAANFSGAVAGGLTFRAWDQSTGSNGSTGVDVSTNGGTTPYSTATAAVGITVNPTNDAPSLAGANDLTAINEDDTANAGTLVSDLISTQVTDSDPGALAGIAVIGRDNTNGSWEYSLNGGTNWTALGAVSNTSATLLASAATNRVRFVPNADFNGTVVGGLTFRAWDQTSGTDGGTGVDVSTNGGSTAFSSTTAAADLTVNAVNDAPTLAGGNNLTGIIEDDTTNSGDAIGNLIAGQITDVDPGALTGIAVIGRDNTNGTWQFSTNGGGNWTAFGAVSNSSATLLADNPNTRVRFVPTANFNGTVVAGLTFRAWDQSTGGTNGATGVNVATNGGTTAYSSATAAVNITVDPANDAPVLNGANALTAINEDTFNSTGDLVNDLIVGQLIEVDSGAVAGVAVVGRDNANGTWEYSTDGGANWIAFGTLSNTSATLLAANALNRVRFVPTANFNGTVASGLTIRAWDQTAGTDGATGVNVSANGGTTAYSSATAAVAITVNPVNDAPVLAGSLNLTAINEDDFTSAGTQVLSLLTGQVTEVDAGSLRGIAVIAVDNTNGVWEYSTNSGANWTAFAGLSNTTATLLSGNATTFVRFVPNADFNGTVVGGLTFRAWDRTSGANGQTGVDVSTNGGTTAFSTATAAAGITVNAVNDAPVLAGANNLATINEDDVTNPGTLVSDLILGQVTDVDTGALTGIAVIGRNNANGTWQFSTNGGTNWNNLGNVSNVNATLLAANANTRVRFVPAQDFDGTVVGGLTFRAWDRTSGSNGQTGVNVSTNGGTTAFSTATAAASITVNAENDAPVLAGANDLTGINEDDTTSAGTLVQDLITGQVTDPDAAPLSGIAVIGQNTAQGTWQFSLDNGGNWTTFGALSNTSATLLAANALTRVRFVPTANFSGTVSPGLTFRAWDQTLGANGATGVNVSTNGGITPYSSATAAANIVVAPVADVPLLAVAPVAVAGFEGVAVPLGISGQLTDTDGSEALRFIISGLVASDTLRNTNGDVITGVTSITLTPAQLAGLTLTVADDKGRSNFNLDVVARSRETLAPNPTADSAAQQIAVAIANLAPVLTTVEVPAGNYNEGSPLGLRVLITDVTADVQQLTIDWGDGSPVQVVAGLAPGLHVINHLYLDNANFLISVTATDDGGAAGLGGTNVLVNNLAPSAAVSPVVAITEGGTAIFAGLLADPGTADTLTVDIDWKNGLTNLPNLPEASWGLNLVRAYPDVPAGTLNDTVQVQVTLTDDDGGQTVLMVPIVVNNFLPVLGPIVFVPDTIVESQAAALSGLMVLNPLVEDSFTVTLSWGDGTPPAVLFVPNGQTVYNAVHVYLDDNPTATPQDLQTVNLTVVDDEGGAVLGQSSLTVQNAAPTIVDLAISQVGADGKAMLSVEFADVGADTFQIRINWLDGTIQFFNVPQSGVYNFEHQYFGNPDPNNPAADIPVQVRVRDDDLGQDQGVAVASVPGTGLFSPVFILPETPRIVLTPVVAPLESLATVLPPPPMTTTTTEVVAARAEAAAGEAFQVGLRVVNPDGTESEVFVLSADVLDRLPELFTKLPDNHYRLYLKRGASERLVLDVYLRGGRPADPADDAKGTRDRPPSARRESAKPAEEVDPTNGATDPGAGSGDEASRGDLDEEAELNEAANEPGPALGAPALGTPQADAPLPGAAAGRPAHHSPTPHAPSLHTPWRPQLRPASRSDAWVAAAGLGVAASETPAARRALARVLARASREGWWTELRGQVRRKFQMRSRVGDDLL